MSTFRFWSVPKKGPEQTRRLVEELARIQGHHPTMRYAAVKLMLEPYGVDPRDQVGAVRAIHAWVRDHVRFVDEPGESILTPARVLLWRYGDCDDRSCLVAALLEAIRIPWRLMLLARRVGGRLAPFHIWPQAFAAGRWVDVETSDRRAEFGEHPAALMRRLRGLSL